MSSISLYRKRYYVYGSSWTDWTSFSTQDSNWIGSYDDVFRCAVYRASLSLTGGQKMTGVQFKTNLTLDYDTYGTTFSGTVSAYLYTSDPTTSSSLTGVPSGYIASKQQTMTITYDRDNYATFSFTGLNISSGSALYVLFTSVIDNGRIPTIISYNRGITGSGTPTVSGTFETPDTTAPTVGLSVAYNSTTSITLNATANVNCKTWQYKLDSGSWTGFTTSPNGATSASQTLTITAGTHTVQVRATKVSNSVVGTSSSVSVDSAAPTVSFSISNVGLSGFTINATSNVNCNKWQYKIGSGSWTSFSTTNGKSASKTITGLSRGTAYTVYVRAYKTSNGLSHTPSSQSVTTLTLTLSISPSSVATGGNVTLTVNNGNGISCSYTLRKTNGSGTTLATGTFSTGSKSIACDRSWFDTVTGSSTMTVHVTVTDNTTTMTGTFTLTAGSDMKPTVGTPAASVVDLTGNFPSTYIAGYTKVKVEVELTAKNNATFPAHGVKLSYPGGTSVDMVLNSQTGKYWPDNADHAVGPITANTTFTVTATDSRGLTSSQTVSVNNVVPYVRPTIAVSAADTYRCNSSGTQVDGGTYYRVKATAQMYTTNLSGNTVHSFTVQIKNSGSAHTITSGTQSSPFSGMSNADSAYTIVFTLQDKVSAAVTLEYRLPGAMHDFMLTRGTDGQGAHASVGMAPSVSTGKSSIELPEGGRLMIGGKHIHFPPGTYTQSMPGFGYINNTGKVARLFLMPVCTVGPTNTITVSAVATAYIMTVSGNYLGTGGGDFTSYISSSGKYGGTIDLQLTNNNGWGETAKTPITAIVKITFTVT